MLSLTVVLALAGHQPAQAKPDVPGFGFPADSISYWPIFTLTREPIQKELKLTAAQIAAAKKIHDDLGKAIDAAGDKFDGKIPAKLHAEFAAQVDRGIAELLTADQKRRHRQLTWQVAECSVRASEMATNPVFASELGLTAPQKKAVAEIRAEYVRALGTRQGMPEDVIARADARLSKALTDTQKKKWNDLVGDPFKGEFAMPGFDGGFSPPALKK